MWERDRVHARVREMQAANLPRCDWRDFLKFTAEDESSDPLTAEDAATLDSYFARFLPLRWKDPEKRNWRECACCGTALTGFLLGSFRWGLAHGEGVCGDCGYPARAYHFDVGPITRLELVLQVHPDELKLEEAAA